MKKHTPQALAAAEKWARLTTGFLAALLLFYAYWMLADLKFVPTPAFLPDFLFAGQSGIRCIQLFLHVRQRRDSGTIWHRETQTGSAGIHHSHHPVDPAGG